MDQFKGQPRLPKFALPKRYDIYLKPDLCLCKFSGSVSIDIDILSDTRFLVLNAADLLVHHASVSFTNQESSKVLNLSFFVHLRIRFWSVWKILSEETDMDSSMHVFDFAPHLFL